MPTHGAIAATAVRNALSGAIAATTDKEQIGAFGAAWKKRAGGRRKGAAVRQLLPRAGSSSKALPVHLAAIDVVLLHGVSPCPEGVESQSHPEVVDGLLGAIWCWLGGDVQHGR